MFIQYLFKHFPFVLKMSRYKEVENLNMKGELTAPRRVPGKRKSRLDQMLQKSNGFDDGNRNYQREGNDLKKTN